MAQVVRDRIEHVWPMERCRHFLLKSEIGSSTCMIIENSRQHHWCAENILPHAPMPAYPSAFMPACIHAVSRLALRIVFAARLPVWPLGLPAAAMSSSEWRSPSGAMHKSDGRGAMEAAMLARVRQSHLRHGTAPKRHELVRWTSRPQAEPTDTFRDRAAEYRASSTAASSVAGPAAADSEA